MEKRKIGCIGCVLIMLLVLLSPLNVSATQSRTENFNKAFNLSGNQANDICSVALAQYQRTGAMFGYTEGWCADFVSDCAILAGASSAIPATGGVSYLKQNILNAGGQVVSMPQVGDIAFMDWGGGGNYYHVEIVYQVSGSTVYTIGGNSGRNTSSDSTSEVWKHGPYAVNHRFFTCFVRPNYKTSPLVDTIKPTIEDVYVKDITDTGYTIHCIVRDNQELSRVQFPTWTSITDASGNNQDDITWGEYIVSGTSWELNYRVNYSDHRNDTNCWYWTDIYCYDSAGNLETYKTVSQYVTSKYSLDVNGMLDGREDGGLGDYGTCDVYINGELKADDCNDFYSANGTWEQGSTYEIRDIKATKCHKYEGVHSGSLSGTLNANTSVYLKFVTAHDYQKQEIKATCVNPAGAKYTCKNCGDTYTEYAAADWSDWSETYPQGVDQKLVESRTEYSYSDKQTTTSESSSLSGWTQTGSEPVYSDWRGWSAWQTEPVTSGETVDVASEKVYRYYYFYCPVCGGREPFQGLSDCGQYTLTLSDAHTGWFTLPYAQSNPQSYNYTTAKVYTTAPDGNRWNFSKSNLNDTALGTLDAGNSAVVITTGYRSRTRSRTGTKYYYEKWGDWSDWTATAVTESSARQVKTRTVYRYNRTPYGNHSYDEGTISNNTVTYKCVKCDNIKKVPLITVSDNSGTLVVKLAATNKITAQGIVYGKGNNVTLETPGRTRIAYSKVDSNRRYTFDTAKLTGCTIRAYVVYTDKNGKEQVVYSSSYTR
nr:CHAP domain-containing protein [uncultured Blautia sp.]